MSLASYLYQLLFFSSYSMYQKSFSARMYNPEKRQKLR